MMTMTGHRWLQRRVRRSTVVRLIAVGAIGVASLASGTAAASVVGGGNGTPQIAGIGGTGSVTATPTDGGADVSWPLSSALGLQYYTLAVTDTHTGAAFVALTHGNYGSLHLSELTNGDPYSIAVVGVPLGLAIGQTTVTPGATPFTPAPAASVLSVSPISVAGGGTGLSVKVAAAPTGSGVNYTVAVAVNPAGVTVARGLTTGSGQSSITLGPLDPSTSYRIAVASHTPQGQGPLTWSTGSTGSSSCPAGGCLTVAPTGQPFTPSVNGLLNDAGMGALEHNAVTSLHPGFVRTNVGYGSAPGTAAAVSGLGATLIENLADAWYDKTDSGLAGGIEPPWECWSCYTQFITSQVSSIEASGVHPTYWELENEPGAAGTYPPHLQGDASLYLQQLELGAAAVHSVDPTAKILAPTDGSFAQGSSSRLDQPTIPLDLVLANASQIPGFAGLDWHEISTTDIAAAAAQDVTQAKALATQAGLPNIATVISEYTTPYDAPLAGTEATWMGALSQSGVTQASRACWANQPGEISPLSTCQGMADGLVDSLGNITGPGQVALDYGNLNSTGATASTVTSTSPFVSATASTNAQGVINLLVGHEASCLPGSNTACPSNSVASSGPVAVRVTVPVSSAQVSEQVQTISSATGAAQVTTSTPTVLTASGGQVVFTVTVADGGAQQITLTPVAAPQHPAASPSPTPTPKTTATTKSTPPKHHAAPVHQPVKHPRHKKPHKPHKPAHPRHKHHTPKAHGLGAVLSQVETRLCQIICI